MSKSFLYFILRDPRNESTQHSVAISGFYTRYCYARVRTTVYPGADNGLGVKAPIDTWTLSLKLKKSCNL